MSSARQRAGRLDLSVLAAIAFVAGLGVFTVATVADRAVASVAAPLVLVLVAVVAALPGALRPSAARRHRVRLARLRGVGGSTAAWQAVRGLLAAALLGTGVGALVGWLAADSLVDRVAPTGSAAQVPVSAWVLVATTAVALALVVLAGAVPLARATMAELVLPRRVARGSHRLIVVLRVLLVVVAGVAVVQARSVGGEWRAVAALGLAAVGCGVLADLGVRWASARGSRAITETGALRPEVALRRVGHPTRGSTAYAVPVVAVAVVAIVVAVGSSAAGAWREDTTRIELGGPVRYAADGGPLAVLEAARQADPDGQWLMPVAVFRDDPDGPERRVYVDTERWGRVSSGFLSGTEAAGVTSSVDELQVGGGVEPLTGDRMSFTMDAPADLTVYDFTIRVGYTNDDGSFVNVELPVTNAAGAGNIDAGVSVPIDDCTKACTVSSVTFEGYAYRRDAPISVGPFMLGDTNVWKTAEWKRQKGSAGRFEPTDSGADVTLVVPTSSGVKMAGSLPISGSETLVVEATSSAALPVITAGEGVRLHQAKLIDGAEVPVEVVGSAAALPLIGAEGTMFDLSRALVGHAHSSVGLELYVLARAETPAAVVDALGEAVEIDGGESYRDALAVSDRSPAALEARMMVLVGAVGVLLAVVALLGSTRRLRPALRRESSALHLAGLGTATVRSIGRWELGLTIGWVGLAVLVSSWLTGELLLDALPLVGATTLVPAPTLTMSIASALTWAAAVAVATGLVRWLAVNASAATTAGGRR